MRRKSERNKAKGSPEKKVEKTTRRTTRRRGKASPSTSPELENIDENASNTPYSDEDKESRLQYEEHGKDNEEIEKGVTSGELIKSVLGGDEQDNGSVWKVARADASPGEIQKLKLCRQRNISEASDSSLNTKKSNKWQDSGEGGMEEVDSADEQITSSQKMSISEQIDDPSSSHPGQDSNEEVSDYKENLPETTSAHLSDDKKNIDQLADSRENLPETTSVNLSEPNCEDRQFSNSSTNLPGGSLPLDHVPDCRDDVAECTSKDLSSSEQNKEAQQNSIQSTNSNIMQSCQPIETNLNMTNENINETISTQESIQNKEDETVNEESKCNKNQVIEETASKQNITSEKDSSDLKEGNTEIVSVNNESVKSDFVQTCKNEDDDEEEEGEIREEINEDSNIKSESNIEDKSDVHDNRNIQSSKTESYSLKKKHTKNHDSSSNESDSEHNTTKSKKSLKKKTNSSNVENIKKNRKNKNESLKNQSKKTDENSVSAHAENQVEFSENNVEKEDILEIIEKSDDLNIPLSSSKPAKVSLKRSFSTRLSTDSETKKEENYVNKPIINESNQNKENHADNEQPDQKSATKRRRWGMTSSTDAALAFSISTDSLKALVPGAKPLSAHEVRLTKDEDDEKDHQNNKNEIIGDIKLKNDANSKNDVKKGDNKIDNHITSRRKITVIKETPRPKSPSPPEAQATNILLIKNLVRPFTLNQIKELLSRTGTIVENGFWMDRIKSKCFVEYANEDQAFETRQALHGVSWPPSNPKKLIVDYASKEDMEIAREISKDQPITRKAEPLLSTDLWQQDHWPRDERPAVVNKITVIREWDLGKEDGQLHIKEKERERKEFEKKKRQRSRSPILEAHLPAPARKFKKKEEEPPTAKLLDDLFRKTKVSPCIYWLPLTNEQIIVKEEMRRQHMAEHARRLEEMRRAERNRDTRRRRSPRK